jgi:hypothetical protein
MLRKGLRLRVRPEITFLDWIKMWLRVWGLKSPGDGLFVPAALSRDMHEREPEKKPHLPQPHRYHA